MSRRELLKTIAGSVGPHGAEKIAGGRLRVEKLGVEEALAKDGHEADHHARTAG